MDISEFNATTKPPTGRKMKGRAPPPPLVPQPAPRRIFTARNAVPDGGLGSDDTKENVFRPSVDLLITLPEGFQTSSTVDGRKALMDLLVDLCSQHHLNPAHYTLELLSPGGQPLAFKPNTLLGALDVHHIHIREKVAEEKVVRKPPPKVPEKTVRLVVNYHGTQKAVVRVNPLAPLGSLVPVICDKCEFDPAHVLLLQDNISNHELDLDQSLSELGIRELYVLDQSLESIHSNTLSIGRGQKRGLLGFFKFNRRKTKTEEHTSVDMEADDDNNVESSESYCNGVPAAPCRLFVEARPSTLGQSQSVMNIPRMSPKVEVKKRQAPLPPQALPTLSQAPSSLDGFQMSSSSPSSSQQKKRKAPAPPPTPVPSIAAEDTASEISHSTEDSEPVGSICSSSSSYMEPKAEPASRSTPKAEPTRATAPEETDSALNLKLEEMENNRHSTMAWLHSLQERGSDPAPGAELDVELEAETVSMDSGSSCPDQGYAASEGMAEDSCVISSPSDLAHPASPDGSISLEQGSTHTHATPKDSSSDSDEGCATWGSRHERSSDIYHNSSSGRREDNYEDPELTTQLHQTLADLEADLADADRTTGVSVRELSVSSMDRSPHSEIPVSVVDCEVPVTTIDEVFEDYRHSMTEYEAALLHSMQISNGANQSCSYQPNGHSENRNNNARTSERQGGASATPPHEVQGISLPDKHLSCSREQKDRSSVSQATDTKPKPQRESSLQEEACSVEAQTPFQSVPSSPVECPADDEPATSIRWQTTQSKITQNPTSRFGMKTFTVVPPKPVLAQKPAGSLVMGAIKIDAQGNMVKNDKSQNQYGESLQSGSDSELPLLGKAKAFWSSTEKQELVASSRGRAPKNKDPEILRAPPVEHPAECGKDRKGRPEVTLGEVVETVVELANRKPSNQEPTQQSMKPTCELEQRKDLSFLKPSRRTSSQYVASAISKYTGKPTFKAERIQETQSIARFSVSEQKPPGNQNCSNRPETCSKYARTSSETFQTTQVKSSMLVVNPKRSLSFPDYTSVKSESAAELKQDSTSTSSLDTNPTSRVSQPPNTLLLKQPVATAQTPRSPTRPDAPLTKHLQNLCPAQCGRDGMRPELAKKPEPLPAPCARSEPGQVGPFGPMKKFKPVVLKSVQKETSLHTSLMEEIQMSEGKERLKRIVDATRESTLKKPSFVETENEHSALLSAIRAPNNFSRLRKVQSEAASELEKFRKSELKPSPQSKDTPPLSAPPPPPPFSAPPPPPPPLFAPPPPPALSARAKPTLALKNTGNPEQAREAMLEAIRSGSGAERLKKVPIPTKTVLVNGRLGIIQTAGPLPQEN
ncbi:hypothetical protein ANANG_G00011820 [Anguilla anguilla]|uniref:WH2 domain-containing protein n=1 Tax=Anguilla anguilla TaxID=7936 RepID=A0A9D3N0Z2_ANGAN|nr:hypothetical protein ANANG_G00011820 [Anguilla anguilla]